MSLTVKVFDTVDSMKTATDLSAGMICETLGYHRKGDGGAARYTVEALGDTTVNDLDIIRIGGDNPSLIARFIYEGKPINVLQFGANSSYKHLENDKIPEGRNDSDAIQRAIDYTDELLGKTADNNATTFCYNINTIIVPGGNYVIKDQIVMPPYIQMQLDGDVQFYSFIRADHQLYRFIKEPEMPSVEGFSIMPQTDDQFAIYDTYEKTETDENGKNTVITIKKTTRKSDNEVREIKITRVMDTDDETKKNVEVESRTARMEPVSDSSALAAEREVFVLNDASIKSNDVDVSLTLKYHDGEYLVYKKGIVKIAWKYNDDGTVKNPYGGGDENRYSVKPHVFSEIFSGSGSLTIQNKIIGEDSTCPPYICGLEIGDYTDYIRFVHSASPTKDNYVALYENLRISNLKTHNCYIGILCRANSFYSSVIADSEFFQNKIGIQWGVYGEKDLIMTKNNYSGVTNVNTLPASNSTEMYGISGMPGIDSGERNHFRDCLFTGNKISVNIVLSCFAATFTSCHFDFDNCVFRAAYRANIIVDKCHIEGIGKGLGKKYFATDDELEAGTVDINEAKTTAFKNRAADNYLDEFVGIIYAKPLYSFDGVQSDNRSYVDLSINSSSIVDDEQMPWSLFSYYNKGNAEFFDGHFRSRLHLSNNTYSIGDIAPISFLTTEENGIIHSGFLLSEFPETDNISTDANDEMRYEKFACQNVPVTSRDSHRWNLYPYETKPQGNHRFLSNRTLEMKDPYFKNVTVDESGNYSHVSVSLENVSTNRLDTTLLDENNLLGSIVELIPAGRGAFSAYDKAAKAFSINNLTYVFSEEDSESVINELKRQTPMVKISFDNDLIDCKYGDAITVAIVTDSISFNEIKNNSGYETEIVSHNIIFCEYDDNDNIVGEYTYSIPYCKKTDVAFVLTERSFPSTSACCHIVNKHITRKVKITVGFGIGMDIKMDNAPFKTATEFHGILVEKNK